MFLTSHYHLHPLVKSKSGIVDWKVKEDSSLDIFENDSQHKWTNNGIDQ